MKESRLEALTRIERKLQNLEEQLESCKRDNHHLLRSLQEQFKVGSVPEARKLLKKLQMEEGRLAKEADVKLREFEKLWAEKGQADG